MYSDDKIHNLAIEFLRLSGEEVTQDNFISRLKELEELFKSQLDEPSAYDTHRISF